MGEGTVIAEGPHEAIGRNQTVIDAYLGSHHDQPLSFEEEQAQLQEADQQLDAESPVVDGQDA
jgi:branched-chain amino acid transport system ATP-binding protein